MSIIIFWFRGKEHFRYKVTQSLAEKSRKSDKDALEVMFYLENKRWPKRRRIKKTITKQMLRHM